MCKAGSCRVNLLMKNETRKDVLLAKGQIVATLSTANLIPNKVAPRFRSEGRAYAEASESQSKAYALQERSETTERTEQLLEKLDLSGMTEWEEEDQDEAKKNFFRI